MGNTRASSAPGSVGSSLTYKGPCPNMLDPSLSLCRNPNHMALDHAWGVTHALRSGLADASPHWLEKSLPIELWSQGLDLLLHMYQAWQEEEVGVLYSISSPVSAMV